MFQDRLSKVFLKPSEIWCSRLSSDPKGDYYCKQKEQAEAFFKQAKHIREDDMAPSTALVVASSEPGRTRTTPEEDDVDLPVDLSQLPMIPMAKSLLLVNNFVANTTRFLNHFANDCEERIARVSTSLTRVEIMLAILEAKLDSIPDLEVTESEVQAAGQSISGEAPLQARVEPSIGIDSQDLPSTDDGFGLVPPPPPPPPPSGFDAEAETRLVGMPPPPPPPGLPSFDEDGETSNALVIAPSNELAPAGMFDEDEGQDGFPVLKLKDDPVYAKYFTMRRLGIPDLVIEQKLMLDGMDPSILRYVTRRRMGRLVGLL